MGGFRFFGEVRKPKPISSRSTVTVGNQVTDWRAQGGTVSSVFLETPKPNRVFSPGNRNRNQVTPTPAAKDLQSERTQGFAADPVYVKGEVFAYVGLPQNLKDLKATEGELNAIRKHKCVLFSPFYGRTCRWAMLGELKPKGPTGSNRILLVPTQQNHPLSPLHEPLHRTAKRVPEA